MSAEQRRREQSRAVLTLPALEITQGAGRKLYSFAINGKLVHDFAAVSRVSRAREGGNELSGYQRPEVLSHISEIRDYIESENPMIPNAVVIAFESGVEFEAGDQISDVAGVRAGFLTIEYDPKSNEQGKPGWIVDGQQRLAAIRDARVDEFPICVTAFVATDQNDQREQFILVNSTKPLPKGLIYELLPETDGMLPSMLRRRRFPAELAARLNNDADSSLRGLIKTPTNAAGIVKDNSILRMLENSLTDGVLYRYRGRSDDSQDDVEGMLQVVKSFWAAVATVFEDSWCLPPRRSRLMHGVGIVSLGFLMDAIADRHRGVNAFTAEMFQKDLAPLVEVCRWTSGYWDFGPGQQRRWNELQNTTRDIQLLSNYLLVQYKSRVWDAARGA